MTLSKFPATAQTSIATQSGKRYTVRTSFKRGGNWALVSQILQPSPLQKKAQRLAETQVIAERVRQAQPGLRKVTHLIDPDAHELPREEGGSQAGLDLQRVW